MSYRASRHQCCIVAACLSIVAVANTAESDELWRTVKFRGFYRVNAAGVGRFDWFIIPPEQLERFAPFADKYIELETEVSREPDGQWDDTRRILRKVGAIELLRQPDVKFDLRIVSPGIRGDTSCDLQYTIINAGKTDVVIDFENLRVELQQVPPPDIPPRPDTYLGSGYAEHQLRLIPQLREGRRFADFSTVPIRAVILRPGEQVPLLIHRDRLPGGRYEMTARGEYRLMEDQKQPFFGARTFALPDDATAPRENSLTATAKFTHDAEWFSIDALLMAKTESEMRVFVGSRKGKNALHGMVQIYDEHGKSLYFTHDRIDDDRGYWSTPVDERGTPVQLRIRHRNRFDPSKFSKIQFWALTQHGLELLTVSNNEP